MTEYLPLLGLTSILIMTLILPFSVKIIEEEIEIFLFVMGILAVSISKLWSWHLIIEAIKEPIPITLTVLAMGFLFKFTRKKISILFKKLMTKLRPDFLVFSMVLLLGLLSSVITAIIASIILSEIVTILKFDRKYEIKLVVLACFSIGIGAALTPLGEPLSTIIIAKLKGQPHNANFFYLIKNLGEWIFPGLIIFSLIAAIGANKNKTDIQGLKEEYEESNKTILTRSAKVFLFIMALIFLGKGVSPVAEKYIAKLSVEALYWINSISAILDNATLASAEITPLMSDRQITFVIMGLIISGGMLIPGNIPNIISSSKLNIKSKEWAKVGLPYGIVFMIIYFFILYFLA